MKLTQRLEFRRSHNQTPLSDHHSLVQPPELLVPAGLCVCRYDQLTSYVFGPRLGKISLLPFQLIVLVGIGITYTVVGGESLHGFVNMVNPAANQPAWVFFIVFGGIQLFLSMVSLGRAWTVVIRKCMNRCG